MSQTNPPSQIPTQNPTSTSNPTQEPTSGEPTQRPTGIGLDASTFLSNSTLFSLEDRTSSQGQAYAFLTGNYDEGTLEAMEDWKKAQIFAMATLYFALDGPNWKETSQANWLDSSIDECDWNPTPTGKQIPFPVECDEDGRIIALFWDDVSDEPLAGTIPPEVELLPALTMFSVQASNLEGDMDVLFPPELSSLGNLEILKYGQNEQSGTLPVSALVNIPNLTFFDANDNQLTGSLSPEIALATNLRNLFLEGNPDMLGPLPTELGSMTGLQTVNMGGNSFSGPIPSEYGALFNIYDFGLQKNRLTGLIPTELGNMRVSHFHLADNLLQGPIPSELGQLSQVKGHFVLAGNSLTGAIPKELSSFTILEKLHLMENMLSSQIPTDLGLLTSLKQLRLENNRLTGSIPSVLGLLTTLEQLDLYGNPLTGALPTEIGLLTALKSLSLNGTDIAGRIPVQICALNIEIVADCEKLDCRPCGGCTCST